MSFEGQRNDSDYNTKVQVPRSLSHHVDENPILAGLTSTPKKGIPCETINTCQTLPAKVGVTNKSGFQITRKSIQHEEKEEIKILGQDKENDQSKEETIQGSTSFLSSEENTPLPLSSDNATRNQGLDNNGDFPKADITNASSVGRSIQGSATEDNNFPTEIAKSLNANNQEPITKRHSKLERLSSASSSSSSSSKDSSTNSWEII